MLWPSKKNARSNNIIVDNIILMIVIIVSEAAHLSQELCTNLGSTSDMAERTTSSLSTSGSSNPSPSATTSTGKMSRNEKRTVVTFDEAVATRTYGMIPGDNPACGIGTPVTIDWEYDTESDCVVGTLSDQIGRQQKRWDAVLPGRRQRRAKREFAPRGPPVRILNYYRRREILERAGYSETEISRAEREAGYARRQRKVNNLPYALSPVRPLERIRHSIATVPAPGRPAARGDRYRRRVIGSWYGVYDATDRVAPAIERRHRSISV